MKINSTGRLLMIMLFCVLLMGGCAAKAPAFTPPELRPLNITLHETAFEQLPVQGVISAAFYDGTLYLIDKNSNQVLRYTKNLEALPGFGSTGSRDGELVNPQGIVADGAGIHVLDWGNRRIVRYSDEGEFIENIKITEAGDTHTLIFGFTHADGSYYISCSMGDFEPKLMIAQLEKATEIISVAGVGGFFKQKGTIHLLVRLALQQESGQNALVSLPGGAIYAILGSTIKKTGQSYAGLMLSPFIPFQDGLAAFSATLSDIGLYDASDYQLRGSIRLLSQLYPAWTIDTQTQDILLIGDENNLYLVWPSKQIIIKLQAEVS